MVPSINMMQETAILVKATSVSLACASVKFKQPVGEMHVVHISEMESKLPSVACTIRSFICSKEVYCVNIPCKGSMEVKCLFLLILNKSENFQ